MFHRENDETEVVDGNGKPPARIISSGRLYTYDYTVRGFLKEGGDALRKIGAHDVKGTKSKIDQFVFVVPRRIFFLDAKPHKCGPTSMGGCGHPPTPADVLRAAGIKNDGLPLCYYIHKAHDILERPLRAETAMGPRVTLTRSDVLNPGTKLVFTLKVIWPDVFTEEVLRQFMERGELVGYGQWRTGSYGRFTYTMERDPLTPIPARKVAEPAKKRGKAAAPTT